MLASSRGAFPTTELAKLPDEQRRMLARVDYGSEMEAAKARLRLQLKLQVELEIASGIGVAA